jgi:toluene monooxygenase electron transfer component
MGSINPARAGRGGRVRLESEGLSFHCDEGQTVLAAALSAGIDLPYECASGSCGSCRATLSEGAVAALWPGATGLSERDRRKGDRILCCQSLAQSDCVIRIRPGQAVVPYPPARLHTRVRSLRPLNDDVLHLVLEADRPVQFRAGQFMLLEWPGEIGRRAYSMSNLPRGTDRLEFLIKRKPDGLASRFIFEHLKCGNPLQLEGPYGRAWLREDSDRDIVLLAGGSGLAPMWSIALRALELWPRRRLRLLFGVNRASDLFWLDEIRQACRDHQALEASLVLMQPSPRDPLGCQTGTLVEAMDREAVDLGACDLYMAGPPGLIDSVMRECVASGRAHADRVFFDRFV